MKLTSERLTKYKSANFFWDMTFEAKSDCNPVFYPKKVLLYILNCKDL